MRAPQDVVIQMGSQSYAHRLGLYANSPGLQIFSVTGDQEGERQATSSEREEPLGSWCTAAEELGPRSSDHSGPCLLHVRGCTLSPVALARLVETSFLRRYVHRMYWCTGHAASVDSAVGAALALLERTRASWEAAQGTELQFAVRVQTFPRSLEQWLTEQIPLDIPLDPRTFTHTLNFVVAGSLRHADALLAPASDSAMLTCVPHGPMAHQKLGERGGAAGWQPLVLFGVCESKDMWRLPSNREGLTVGCASSAVCKLEEALSVLGWRLHAGMSVIDVGAAPGAWTEYLSTKAGRVLAVDPAPLAEAAMAAHNVTHIQSKVEDAIPEVESWLRDSRRGALFTHQADLCCQHESTSADSQRRRTQSYQHESDNLWSAIACQDPSDFQGCPATSACDALFCDANKHPTQCVHLLKPLLKYLRPGGLVLVTMKCRGRGRCKRNLQEEMQDMFGRELVQCQTIWLLANSVYERTFVAFKRWSVE